MGIVFLEEAVTAFSVAGGALIVAGLALTVKRGEHDDVTGRSQADGILATCPNRGSISSRTTPRTD